MIRARLLHERFAPDRLLAEFLAAIGEEHGAVVVFTGLARGRSKQGEPIDQLFLQHHPRLTERSLCEIANSGAERFGVSAVDVAHRCGALVPGEPIVWVAAASPHRRAAFDAADYLMDRLKTDALFWKREDGAQGSSWIEPTADDYGARARWE